MTELENGNELTAPPGMQGFEVEKPKIPSHPLPVFFFHLIFKILSFGVYLFASFIIPDSYVIPFIICVLLLSFDLWTTKNVTGRLLVGLRWWNEVKEDGTNVWIFESLEQESLINPFESKLFWISLFIPPVAWFLLGIFQILTPNRFNWAILCALGVSLTVSNVIGYIKCARDARSKLKQMTTEFVVTQAMNRL